MADQRSPIDQVLDLLVYAPLGLAITASEELPKLAEKGRQQLARQVPTARAIGQLAVAQGQKQVERMAKRATERLADLGLAPPCPPSQKPSDSTGPGEAAAPAETVEPAATSVSTATDPITAPGAAPTVTSVVHGPPGPQPRAADLAIPGYDSLSAPQVVQRLDGLSVDELEEVRVYESATRRRKTVLTRIAQLQGE